MNQLHKLGLSLFDFSAGLIYLLACPVVSTISFVWILKFCAGSADGQWPWSWSTSAALSPVLYVLWLIWFLGLAVIEGQIHVTYLRYRKPPRATTSNGFRSWVLLTATLAQYLRARFVLSLPMVESLLAIPGLRHLVLRSYSPSSNLGIGSLVLGYLFDPDITTIGEGAIIGSGSSVIGHSLTVNLDGSRLVVTSPITIGARSVIGGAAQIHPGVQIGEDSVIEPASYVPAFTQIGNGEVWGGSPARFLRMRNFQNHSESSNPAGHVSVDLLDATDEAMLRQIVAQGLNRHVESITPALSATDTAAWDSLAQLGMTVELQKQFGITLTNQESFRLRSMCQIREVILRKRSETSISRRP